MRLFLILLSIFILGQFSYAQTSGDGSDSDHGNFDSAYQLKTSYQTEEEWIVGIICRNAYELLSFIADKKGEMIPVDHVSVKKTSADDVSYDVTLQAAKGTVKATLHFPGSIWSSQAYVPFCQAAMEQLKLAPVPPGRAAQGNPLATLLDFSESSLQAENVRISEWLTTEPDNALAQQQAALVLGTMAMKENSGWFWDPRDECNHVIAHLAVARSLTPGSDLSIEGSLAECMVGLIADTKKECADELDRLAKLPSPPPELGAWINASRMRNSRDWRIVPKPEAASAFEQVEYFRAVGEAVNSERALAWLNEKSVPDRQDWDRLVIQSDFSVESGHKYAMPSVDSEISLMQATFPDRFKQDTLTSDLNRLPGGVLVPATSGPGRLSVISDGMWAQYFQRHLCQALVETGVFLEVKWGVPDQAAEFARTVEASYSSLFLYPYLQEVTAILLHHDVKAVALRDAFVKHPEFAQSYIDEIPGNSPGIDVSQYHRMLRRWFSPPLPSGTAYDPWSRTDNVGANLKNQPDAIHKLYAIAPLQLRIAELELTTRFGEHPLYAEVKQVMGPMIDYYLGAQDWAIRAPDLTQDQRFDLEQKAATLDPAHYIILARDLVKSGKDSEAADAYQKWYDLNTDRVTVSNGMEWLVNYDYDHGQQDKALAIAKDGAEVYSYRGLETMMHLQARMGQLDQAEDYGQKIKERYNDEAPLISFYQEQAAKGNADYKAKLNASLSTIFPSGQKQVTLASFNSAPSAGVQFGATTPTMSQDGLSSSQVIVALDGYQVDNQLQYTFIREQSTSPSMDFIVWDGAAYKEIKATQPGRRFGVQLNDYKP
jgi:hypothetical protein